MLGPMPSTQNGFQSFEIDQMKHRVTFHKTDGSIIEQNIPAEAIVKADRVFGVSYQSVDLSFEPLFGGCFVGSTPFFYFGDRIAYAGSFGAHVGVAVSTDQSVSSAFGAGIDFRYRNIIFGPDIQEPFTILKDPNAPLRLGFVAVFSY